MKHLLLGLSALFLSHLCFSAAEPYLTETKVQNDLQTGLSRVIPQDEFLVQVNADVGTKLQRELVEGETLSASDHSQPKLPHVTIMPGFVPDPELDMEPTTGPQVQNRQVFRTVEKPVLNALHVGVKFDDTLPLRTVSRAEQFVQDYLRSNYPIVSRVSFGQMSMLKDQKDPDRKPQSLVEKTFEKQIEKISHDGAPSQEDTAWQYGRWALVGLLLVIALLLTRQNSPSIVTVGGSAPSRSNQRTPTSDTALRSTANPTATQAPEKDLQVSRARGELIRHFLSHAEAFRQYYTLLGDRDKDELCGALKGPAYNSLLEGLSLPYARDAESPHDAVDVIGRHEKDFDEFVHAEQWKNKQFFGFLQGLNDEQLLALVSHHKPIEVCLMLRFMRPSQSALTLESLSPARKVEVLSHVKAVQEMSFAEMVELEHSIRRTVEKMPGHLFGSKKEDVAFWGNVLTESQDQKSILEALEKTNPEIFPSLAKFRFSLEDAASLPNNILSKVLKRVDNEELSLALAGCSKDVAEVILDAVSENRRAHVLSQLPLMKNASKEEMRVAKLKLTRQLREEFAA